MPDAPHVPAPGVVVDRVVSVGSNCEVTDSLRDYYGTTRAYPFDWWITPMRSVVRMLESRFEGLYDEKHLEISADAQTVICRRYEVLHHHDFARGPDGRILPDLRSQLPAVREKFRHLTARFLADCAAGRTLFVRNREGESTYLEIGDGHSDEALLRLEHALRSLFPQGRFTLLATNLGRRDALAAGRIRCDEIVDHGDGHAHRVSPRGWNELLDRQGFRLA